MMDLLIRTGDFVRGLTGWRRFLLAFGTGAFSALAFAPLGIFPALLLAFAVLVLLIDGAHARPHPVRGAAVAGWAFGFGQFLAGLYWIAYAFLVDPLEHAWQIPIAAMLLPGGLALYMALACGVASRFWREGWPRIFLLAAAYAAAEWLRGHLLTGFPWNIPAYGWGASLAILQSAAFVGAYGLSLLTVLFGASLALFCDARPRAWIAPVSIMALFALIWMGGEARLAGSPPRQVAGVRLHLVQPNIPQQEKYVPGLRARNWRRLVELSIAGKGLEATHIIWPEAAPPFLLAREPQALDDVALLTGQTRVLMTGALRAEVSPEEPARYFNAFYIFGHGGALLSTYDKFHLVPFGEYLPLPGLLHALGITKLVDMPDGFVAGDGPHTYKVPGAPDAGPLICYEILFPGEVVSAARRPQWLANVTDDSWFGPPSSSGPYQHFLTARVRAIEEGLPVVRAANTGITGVIDPFGRIESRLGMGRAGYLDTALPQAISMTIFVRLGDAAFLFLLLGCIVTGFAMPAAFNRKKPSGP
jgi:apolipoprotein N-acyltransferase